MAADCPDDVASESLNVESALRTALDSLADCDHGLEKSIRTILAATERPGSVGWSLRDLLRAKVRSLRHVCLACRCAAAGLIEARHRLRASRDDAADLPRILALAQSVTDQLQAEQAGAQAVLDRIFRPSPQNPSAPADGIASAG